MSQFSANMHDRLVEAAATAAFVFGPVGAVLAFIGGFVYAGRDKRDADPAR